jgi:mannose-6-phosphate isomerase
LLRQMPAYPGATYVVPAGTPHAVGANVMIYEIQQPSTITYRLDDWGRVDASGAPRKLHIDAGLESLDATSRPEPVPRAVLQSVSPHRELLAATRYFVLERLAFVRGDRWRLDPVASPQVLTLLEGQLHLESGAWSAILPPWKTLIIPVGLCLHLIAEQPSLLLRGWVPDLDQDVLAPARAAGIPEASINALGVHIRG